MWWLVALRCERMQMASMQMSWLLTMQMSWLLTMQVSWLQTLSLSVEQAGIDVLEPVMMSWNQ